MSSIKKVPLSVLLFLSLVLAGCQLSSTTDITEESDNTAPNNFSIGLLPTESASLMQESGEDLADFLGERMHAEVEVFIPSSYEVLIQALESGQVQAAFFDSGPAVLANHRLGAEVVLAEVQKGETSYTASLFVRADDDRFKTLQDVLGKKIAFTSWTGSSGFFYPIGSLVSENLLTLADDTLMGLETALSEHFESHIFSGGYAASLDLLLNNDVDVIGGAHDIPERFLSDTDQTKVKKWLELGPVPSHPVVVHPDLDEDTRAEFIAAMLELNHDDNDAILHNLYGVDGLQKAETQAHLGDFAIRVKSLPALEQKLLDKKK